MTFDPQLAPATQGETHDGTRLGPQPDGRVSHRKSLVSERERVKFVTQPNRGLKHPACKKKKMVSLVGKLFRLVKMKQMVNIACPKSIHVKRKTG
jgi:hypothetical protein